MHVPGSSNKAFAELFGKKSSEVDNETWHYYKSFHIYLHIHDGMNSILRTLYVQHHIETP